MTTVLAWSSCSYVYLPSYHGQLWVPQTDVYLHKYAFICTLFSCLLLMVFTMLRMARIVCNYNVTVYKASAIKQKTKNVRIASPGQPLYTYTRFQLVQCVILCHNYVLSKKGGNIQYVCFKFYSAIVLVRNEQVLPLMQYGESTVQLRAFSMYIRNFSHNCNHMWNNGV